MEKEMEQNVKIEKKEELLHLKEKKSKEEKGKQEGGGTECREGGEV